ncbi:hypothetical protein SOVF_166460 [Spinacia oleracea]|nr:hypothetical protein SOVF_166460 [Spinacia oleracea]
MRSGSVTYEEGLPLDTSKACDACDIWYSTIRGSSLLVLSR